MYMTEISEDKYECLAEHIKKGLKCLGKAMHYLEEMHDEDYENDEEDDYSVRKNRSRLHSRYSRY